MILEAAAAGDAYKVKLHSGVVEWRGEAQLRRRAKRTASAVKPCCAASVAVTIDVSLPPLALTISSLVAW